MLHFFMLDGIEKKLFKIEEPYSRKFFETTKEKVIRYCPGDDLEIDDFVVQVFSWYDADRYEISNLCPRISLTEVWAATMVLQGWVHTHNLSEYETEARECVFNCMRWWRGVSRKNLTYGRHFKGLPRPMTIQPDTTADK